MKRVIFALLAIAIITSCAKNNKVNFTIDGTLANGIEAEGDTAYLFLTDYGSATFVDSCRIENGKFNLKANIPFDGFIGYVIIGNHEGSSGLFIVDRDENLTMEYTPSADYEQAVVGGSARYDEYKEMQKQLEPILAIGDDIFTRIRAMQIDDPQIAIIADSIDMISAQRKEMMYEQTMNATHAFNAISGAMSFEGDARKVDIDQYVIETFGDYRLIGFLTNKLPSGEEPAPLSEEAAQALNRYDILTGNLPRYPDGAPTDSDNEVKVEETVIIAPPGKTIEPAKPVRYKTGDTILAFEFETFDGLYASVVDTESDYILLDFWASWCAPCRKEIPYLKSAVKEFPNLAVHAVSIDTNIFKWKDAIKVDESNTFRHFILRNDNPLYDDIMTLFDIKTIPRNVLINKDLTIIAENLRGDDIKTFMASQIKK